MKNKIGDLRNHMFVALERLNNEELKDDELKTEILRAQAIAYVGKVLVDSAKAAVMYAKATGRVKELEDDDFIEDSKKSERPKAEYSNNGHVKLLQDAS